MKLTSAPRRSRTSQSHILDTLIYGLVLGASLFTAPAAAITLPFVAPSEETLAGEGIYSNTSTLGLHTNLAAPPSDGIINRAGWTISVDSNEAGFPATNAIDGNSGTYFHSEYSPTLVGLPHTITIDMKSSHNVAGLTYQPRQDGSPNGNIGQHEIYTSTDGSHWTLVALGTFYDDSSTKAVSHEVIPARYVRITALSEAGNRGPWTSAAEIQVYYGNYNPPSSGQGQWGLTINFPTVPVAASLEQHTWSLLVWSSYSYDSYTGAIGGKTFTAMYNPYTQTVTDLLVTNTQHDMFCPGLSMDFNGRSMVTGGNNAQKLSIYDPASNVWIAGPDMIISRGYAASCTLSDGRTFVIGGSWSGGQGGKNGEVYNPATNSWTSLPGCSVNLMLTNDAQGVYRADNHGWLFGWKNGCLFQAGPSKNMNWYCASGTGGQKGIGTRANDGDSMCGNAVMYDAVNGKILTMGGSPNYQGSAATENAHIITIGNVGDIPTVETVSSMAYERIFANAVVLPDGKVFVTGGQSIGDPFSDANSVFTPEMWDPATKAFTQMAPNTIPRNYHSFALLMLDGTVISGGGGLCGTCSTNHFDAQIYTPPYLLNANGSPATRPTVTYMSTNTVTLGGAITIGFNSGISSLCMIRYGTATHTVDTDQRRIALSYTSNGGNRFTFNVPSDAGIAIPGYWMVFGLNSAGVPAVAQTIQVQL